MLRPYACEFVYLVSVLERLVSAAAGRPFPANFSAAFEADYPVAAKMLGPPPANQNQEDLIRYLLRVVPFFLATIPMPSVVVQHERVGGMLGKGRPAEELAAAINELATRFRDELEKIQFLHVRAELVALYESEMLFGEQVNDNFASAIDDIADAGKCLALGQGTAAVFHLMRVMEAGLKALSKSLGIPYAPSWESHLRQINDRIATKHKQKGIRWKRDEAFYRDVAGDLQSVKVAWRNPTMHIVKKYTPDEADDVFRTVRTFMKRLATRLKE